MEYEKKPIIINIILFAIFTICMFTLGWFSNEIYKDYNYQRQLEGFYAEDWTFDDAENYAYAGDKRGDWIYVNVRDIDYDNAYEICVHECSHHAYSEIFAEYCEDNFDKCREVLNKTK